MPVSSENSIAGPYYPNGSTANFAFDFKAASADEVVAVDSDGNLLSTALYSVTLDDDEGGTLSFAVPPQNADYPVIYVVSEPELTQPSDFDNTGPSFNPAALTRALDRAAIRDNKLKRDIDRSLKLPFGEESVIFPGAADRANKFISFLPNGNLLMSSGTGADSGLRPDLAEPTGGEMIGLPSGGTVKDVINWTTPEAHGADPTGVVGSADAFVAAFAAADRVVGAPGAIYLIEEEVSVPAGKELIGGGGSLKIGPGVIGFRIPVDSGSCKISGWTIVGNGGLYAVLDQGRFNRFEDMVCRGNIGHYYFGNGADFPVVRGVTVEGDTASTEITTAILLENCTNAKVRDVASNNVMVGWTIQVRGGENIGISQVSTLQEMFTDSEMATAAQTVFNFNIGSVCPFKKVQINGLPLSQVGGNYTITGSGPAYTVTFAAGRSAGEIIRLVGYRGAENIQINNGAKKVAISDFTLNGTGDGGLLVLASEVNLTNGFISNAGYCGLALYGGTDVINASNITIENCAQLDDGLASPDNPAFPSSFAGGLFTSGENINLDNFTFINTAGTMRYAYRLNKTDTVLHTDGTKSINIGKTTYIGDFIDGKIFAPNETTGQRINSVGIAAPAFPYPTQIDIDQDWDLVPYDLTPSPYFSISGFNSHLIRDESIKMGGVASIKTAENSWGQINLDAAGMFYNCVVNVTFWAINASGSSYLEVRTDLGGLIHGLRATITETEWRQYTISLPLTANLERYLAIRVGGVTGSANIQHIDISGQRL